MLGGAAYANSLHGPFLYDDRGSILENPSLRHLSTGLFPPSGGWPVSGRPLLNLSFALNYAWGGENPIGYHLGNLLIHLAAGLLLFGVARRTLNFAGASFERAAGLGWAVALIWTVHPLQTEAVTYISQRAESLMGLFYLAVLYGFIRGVEQETAIERSRARNGWWIASAAACLLGTAAKEVMVTAPVIVLFYDRAFVSGAWKQVWQRHKIYYAALFFTWVPLIALVLGTGGRGGTAGFGTSIPWWAYALTQFRGVTRYLQLSLWPAPLRFDYGLVLGGPPLELAADAVLTVGLASVGLVTALRGSKLGFLLLWFFLILAPSSSIVPVTTELIAEHRVYLSLAGIIALVVLGADWMVQTWAARRSGTARFALGMAAVGIVATAGARAAYLRNRAYGSVLALWEDVVEKLPDDAGARNNYGNALAEAGRLDDAIRQYRAALRLVPGYGDPQFNLGNALFKEGQTSAAIEWYQAALKVQPANSEIHFALGKALVKAGQPASAKLEYTRALQGKSESPVVWYNLGEALLESGDWESAEHAFAAAIRIKPDYADALINHGGIMAQAGRLPEAVRDFQTAARAQPNSPDVHNNLGGVLAESGRFPEAKQEFETALRLKPDYREARDNLSRVTALIQSAPRP